MINVRNENNIYLYNLYMNTLLLGTKAISLLSGLSTELLVQTVKTTSHGIIQSINYISTYNTIDLTTIQKDLEVFDLENKITIITKFIEEIKNKKNIKESIRIAIISVHYVLEKINDETEKIKDDIKYHESKYFNSWRSLDCSNKINELDAHNKLLDTRFELLMKLLSIKYD